MRQIVVDSLRHAQTNNRIAERLADLRHLQSGVHGVIAAVIEEIADVMRAEDVNQPFVLGTVLFQALQFEARRSTGARGGVLQATDGRGSLAADGDEILRQRPDDAVASCKKLADVLSMPLCSFDPPAGG